MEDLSKYTPIELNKMVQDVKKMHDALKQDIINDTLAFDDIEKRINEKLEILQEYEKNYVALIEEMEKR